MSKPRLIMEKDGLQANVIPAQVEGLEAVGWTLVDDGSSESGQENAPEGAVEGDPGL